MSRIPEIGRLSREDFPDQADWIDRLLRPINSFFTQASGSLRALTREQNMDSQVQEWTFTTGAAVADSFPYKFQLQMSGRPRTLWVGRIENLTTEGATFTTAVFPSWSLTGSEVKITHITGLSTSTKYRVIFILE